VTFQPANRLLQAKNMMHFATAMLVVGPAMLLLSSSCFFHRGVARWCRIGSDPDVGEAGFVAT